MFGVVTQGARHADSDSPWAQFLNLVRADHRLEILRFEFIFAVIVTVIVDSFKVRIGDDGNWPLAF